MELVEAREILERVKSWPVELQVQLAEVAEMIEASNAEPNEMDDETRAAIAEGLAQADRGEFATDEEVKAAFASFRR